MANIKEKMTNNRSHTAVIDVFPRRPCRSRGQSSNHCERPNRDKYGLTTPQPANLTGNMCSENTGGGDILRIGEDGIVT